jgi:hypothetical protein
LSFFGWDQISKVDLIRIIVQQIFRPMMAVESAENRHMLTVADDSYGAVLPWELFPALISGQLRKYLLCDLSRMEADQWNKRSR